MEARILSLIETWMLLEFMFSRYNRCVSMLTGVSVTAMPASVWRTAEDGWCVTANTTQRVTTATSANPSTMTGRGGERPPTTPTSVCVSLLTLNSEFYCIYICFTAATSALLQPTLLYCGLYCLTAAASTTALYCILLLYYMYCCYCIIMTVLLHYSYDYC